MKKVAFCVICLISIFISSAMAGPKVIKMEPENGSTDVDPKTNAIILTFDEDMKMYGGRSICGGGDTFPKLKGRHVWMNERMLAIKVKLRPNHFYNFSINCSNSGKWFRSASDEPADYYRISFKTRGFRRNDESGDEGRDGDSGNGGDRLTAEKNGAAVSAIRDALESRYSYNEMKGVDWDAKFGMYEKELLNAKTAEQFGKYLAVVLSAAEDKHIWVKTEDGGHFPTYRNTVKPNGDFETVKKVVPNFRQLSRCVFAGKFEEENVGYIAIGSWGKQYKEAIEKAYVVLGELRDTDGLIIDVRFNGGGSEPLAQEFAGCFVEEEKVYAKHVYRNGEGFGEPSERVLKPNAARPRYEGDVSVLMGPVCMSSNEAFLLMMKQVPGCKLVGENSYGSSGNPKPVELGNGVIVYLPSWKAMRPDGTCFEGEGVRPDLVVETSESDFEDSDPVIEKAILSLRDN